MPIDTQGLKDEIRRLTLILELANDPKSRETLERFVTPSKNGHKSTTAGKPAVTQVPLGLVSGSAQSRQGRYGLMARYAYEVLSDSPQTPQQIADQMILKGFQFPKGQPKYLVGDALRNLESKGSAKRSPELGKFGATQWLKAS
jgi:hypothetical protein